MALQNRIEYGFNGYQVPPTPRAARSVRKRCLFKRKEDGQKQMCAFDLLATVADRILLDGKFSPHEDSSEKAEHEKIKSPDKKPCYERNFMFTEFLSQSPHKNTHSDELGCTQNDVTSRPASGLTSSDASEKVEQLIGDECKLQLGIPIPSLDANSSGVKLVPCFGSEDENSKQIKTDEDNNRNLSMMSITCSRNQGVAERWDGKTSHVVSSVDSVNFSIYRDKTARCPVLNNNPDSVKLVDRDYGEEDYSKSIEPSDRNKALTPLRDGYRRFKKVTSSNHFKESADTKDDERYNPDTERCNQKNIMKEQRSLKDYPIKKRKLYACSSDYNQEEGIYCIPQNCSIGIVNDLAPTVAGDQMPAAGGGNGNGNGNGSTSLRRNQQVKLRIKSFRVPELYVEIPETATVGCLKRAVMEAVNEVLGNGLRVGVLLQGKKIREDGKTLQQTGISHRADNLGFCLEPDNNFPFPINASSKEHPRQVLHDGPRPLARYPPTLGIAPNGFHHQKENLRNNISGTGLKNLIGSSRDDSAPCLDIVASSKASSESKAIVPLQTTRPDAAALSAIPLRKCKRSESAQRRIRRPFTVAEVEALVQAVEKLGTGRWRDVKLRAFDHAKHRTYVDLKDKWKTLVHTARISPQQRRGEPVPQELLDRVLTAHAYWSQQQAKQQQLKSHTTDTRLVL